MRAYRTVKAAAETQIVINKSRFIGRCFPVGDEGEALALLEEIRKRHWDASHNCYAYRIVDGPARYSDDGEPGGTAGLPMMEVLNAKELHNTLVIVTRYFGGVLLGAGGLVRAYSRAAADAAAKAGVVEMRPGRELTLCVEYPRYGAVETLLRARAQILRTDFADMVTLTVLTDEADALIAAVVERTDGRCVPEITGEGYLTVEA